MIRSGTNRTVALVVIAMVACSKQDRPADRGSAEGDHDLPVPHKLPPPTAPARPADTHGTEIDTSYATVLAMYKAPEGATPCESAHNAVIAEQAAAATMKRASIFSFVATKDEFIKVCAALPAAAQNCLVPRYQARNRESCASDKAPEDTIKKLYEIRTDLDQPAEPGQPPP
ncbi:hypothetical protein BH11MYX3_BH11MYX3_35920 [soil metagenome]